MKVWKIATFLLAAATVFLLFLLVLPFRKRVEMLDSPAVVKEIRQMNELVTIRYTIEKVVGLKEQRSPVGTESILLLVQGRVLAGINLSELNADDVRIGPRRDARIHLPEPHIQETFLEEKETKVWDRTITWWTPWVSPDPNLEHRARLQAISDIKQAATDMGILKEARRNAETSIRILLQTLGIQSASFYYGS